MGSAKTALKFNCVYHSIRSMFRVLGMYNFGSSPKVLDFNEKKASLGLGNHLKGLNAGQQASKQLPQFLTVTDVKHVGKQTR